MNGKIKILDEAVANIIAAGEVVENPASMIKELIENSLDAGADSIFIEVENGGKYVKISDNGEGMNLDDLYLSIERHSTSKISTKEDIFNLKSYGFRGEALASIAAVSKLTMSSKTEEESVGNKIFAAAGNIKKSEEIQKTRGTEIEIKDLFYNTPARLKFLRGEATEYNKIKDIITKEAIGSPNCAFLLKINGKESIRTSGKGIENCIVELFGSNILKNMIKSNIGYLGNSGILKNSKEYIYTFFNRRYAKSQLIDSAVLDGYYTRFEKGKYPFVILFVDVLPSEIDVNVHPSKKVVKFSNGSKIYDKVKKEIEKALDESGRVFTPKLDGENETVIYEPNSEFKKEMIKGEKIEIFSTVLENSNKKEEVILEKNREESFEIKEKIEENNERESIVIDKSKNINTKIIGQLKNMYILCESETGLEVYDQHIVHERILYEELKKNYADKRIDSQHLLIPVQITLDKKSLVKVSENIEIFKEFGFEVEEFGETEILMRAVPAFDFRDAPKEIFLYIVDNIEKSSSLDLIENIIISMSCKGAIKAGEYLKFEEMEKLINKLHEIGKYSCPHGRPIILRMPYEEMDKKFGRK